MKNNNIKLQKYLYGKIYNIIEKIQKFHFLTEENIIKKVLLIIFLLSSKS